MEDSNIDLRVEFKDKIPGNHEHYFLMLTDIVMW